MIRKMQTKTSLWFHYTHTGIEESFLNDHTIAQEGEEPELPRAAASGDGNLYGPSGQPLGSFLQS